MSVSIISIIGLGYIGLPTAAAFASKKKKVIGVDINEDTVNTINDGKIHITEPGLELTVNEAVNKGYFKAVIEPEPADAFLIAVPTPFFPQQDDTYPKPDLSYVEAAARSIAPVLNKGNLVILESTCPVGTTELMAKLLAEERDDLSFPHTHGEDSDIRIAYCPERILPGNVISELIDNDRVIGGMTKSCSEAAAEVYKIFVKGNCMSTDSRTAEMIKLTENASRDVNIALANELSIICDELGIDVWEMIRLANNHPRVNILQPGPGVGGHCIAVDPWFIVSKSPNSANLIREARRINDNKPHWVIEKVKSVIKSTIHEKKINSIKDISIACYGLSFKANIEDLRESPAISIVSYILEMHQGKVLVVEPNIEKLPNHLKKAELTDFNNAAKKADIHILLVDHREFQGNQPLRGEIIDTRGIWNDR